MKKMWLKKLLFLAMCVLVSCKNSRSNYKEKEFSRQPKFLTFNTVDEDINVNLEFSIPFITISTKKAVDTAFGFWPEDLPTININPGSLAVGGAVVLATTVLIPVMLKSFAGYGHYPHQHYGRLLESAEFSTDGLLDFANRALTDSQVVRGCALKMACWSGQNATTNSTKFLTHIMRNQLLSTLMNSTAVEEAMVSGRNGRDCNTYPSCPLIEGRIPYLWNNIAEFSNRIG